MGLFSNCTTASITSSSCTLNSVGSVLRSCGYIHLFCLQAVSTNCISLFGPVWSLTFIPLFTCILTDSQSILLLVCSCLSLFSAALLLLSIIPLGRTALLIMQHIILLASLSRELLCRLGSRIWSQATGLFTASLHNKRVRESEGGKELERDMVTWPVR